jgi:hypothetical protein
MWMVKQCGEKTIWVEDGDTYLYFGIGPARNLNNHVEYVLVRISYQWDIMKR